jgi:hypothetical protein
VHSLTERTPRPPSRRVDVHLVQEDLARPRARAGDSLFVAAPDADSITYRAGLVFEEWVDVRECQFPSLCRVFETETSFVHMRRGNHSCTL